MIDLHSIPNLLGLGGVATAVALYWGSFRNLLRQASSLVLVQAEVDYSMHTALRIYLKSNYKRLPSGLFHYDLVRCVIRQRQLSVPFRLQANRTVVYWRAWDDIVIANTASIMGVRGLCKLDELVASALKAEDARAANADSDRSSFYYVREMGNQGEQIDFRKAANGASKSDSSSDQQPPVRSNSNNITFPTIDLPYDTSYAYTQDEYIVKSENSFEHLYFDESALVHLRNAELWLKMRDWYSERSIPWRMGWLLHGPGGTGKSTFALATAKYLKVPIVQFYLNTMSDREFIQAWEDTARRSPCIVLFEDFDNVFHGREAQSEHKSLTFDCVLNQISGVQQFGGILLIITTNHLKHIDPAMGVSVDESGTLSTRPGRIDQVIRMEGMSQASKLGMIQNILRDWPELIEQTLSECEGYTPAQVQEVCVQTAYRKLQAKLTHNHDSTNI